MKDRVTLTIERSLLKQIDASIDGTTIKNRSHAVELLLTKALQGDLPECAVVLAGATDAQLEAVCGEWKGKPMVRHNVELLSDAGVRTIILITKDPKRVREALGEESRYDADLRFVTETTAMGTAGALHLAQPYLNGPCIITNGDEFKEISVHDLYTFHKEHAGMCTIALTTVPDPTQYGVALLNGNRIITFVEKPNRENAPSNLISAGLYVLEPDVLELIPNGYAKMEIDIFPKLAKDDELYGYHFSGEYRDMEEQ